MKRIQITKHILEEWCEKNMNIHTDWTGTRVETNDTCVSIEEFVDKLWNYSKRRVIKCISNMANHGYCKNCWWWNKINNTEGHCIMQSFSRMAMVRTDENSYCPDYVNREKYTKTYKETLEEFCTDTGLPFFMYYELR